MKSITKPNFKRWFAFQAKELFDEALKKNPNNDSVKVFIGATLLFGEIGESPMQAVGVIKNVVEKDSTFLFGQKMLGWAAFISGQLDKAEQRFTKVRKQNPSDIENLLVLGEILERKGEPAKAKEIYLQIINQSKNKVLIKELKEKMRTL